MLIQSKIKDGIALDGNHKLEERHLASSTLWVSAIVSLEINTVVSAFISAVILQYLQVLMWKIYSMHSKPVKDAFGFIVNYLIRVKLDLGTLNRQMSATLPFVLMPTKVSFIYTLSDVLKKKF